MRNQQRLETDNLSFENTRRDFHPDQDEATYHVDEWDVVAEEPGGDPTVLDTHLGPRIYLMEIWLVPSTTSNRSPTPNTTRSSWQCWQRSTSGTVAYANSQSQRQRLRWLITRASTVPALADPQNRFRNEIIDTRNSYAHLGDDHPNALAPDELHDRVERLIQVIEYNLLLDLGLDEAHAARLLASAHQL